MRGARPLTESESNALLEVLQSPRDRCLVVLGMRTGFRISELLSLRIGDVWRDGAPRDRITVRRCNTKGKRKSRTVPVHLDARVALFAHIGALNDPSPTSYLFASRKGENRPITRHHAAKIIHQGCMRAGLDGPFGTHLMRKTFARNVYHRAEGNLMIVQSALGHDSIQSTISYLALDAEEVEQAILEA